MRSREDEFYCGRAFLLRDLLRGARPCVLESLDEWRRVLEDAGEDAVFALDAKHHIERLRDLLKRIDDELHGESGHA